MRIFVADDSEDARDLIAATLLSGGYDEVHLANSGDELMTTLGVEPVNPSAPQADIILLDVNMPGADGIETCARLRADARYQHTPILMVTSRDDMETLNQAFMAGANDYVNKPFTRTELHARLRTATRLKGELDRRRARESELLAAQVGRGTRSQSGTDVFNPASWLLTRETLESYIAAIGPAKGEALGVLALRIDGLALLRTNYGDGVATDLVGCVADAISRIPARLGDLLSHFDPDVFVALRHDTDQAGLASMAQNARNATSELSVSKQGSQLQHSVTVSIGVARSHEPRASLAAAVSAMERAAGEGGDRILFA